MRILHTADWHLGRLFHGVHLTGDQERLLFDGFLPIVAETKPDVLVVAGDLYDRAVPPTDAVKLLDAVLEQVRLKHGVPVLMISGNHDSAERVQFGSSLLSSQNIHVRGRLRAVVEPVTFEDAHGPVDFYLLPYAEPAGVRFAFDAEADDCRTHDQAAGVVMAALDAERLSRRRSVLVAHCFLTGGCASESERPLSVGLAEEVGGHRFEEFEYVALGHLHRPQTVGREECRYSGSLMRYSFDEAGNDKSLTLVEMDGAGACTVEQLPLTPTRQVRRIRGRLAALLEQAASDDYLMFELEDEGELLDPMGQLRKVYPNALHIEHVARADAAGPLASRPDLRRQSPAELFAAFHRHVEGQDMSDPQTRWLGEAVTAVVHDEQDEG